jgi:hypothetical protein
LTEFVEASYAGVLKAAGRVKPYVRRKLPMGRTGLILSGGNANLETVAKLLGR